MLITFLCYPTHPKDLSLSLLPLEIFVMPSLEVFCDIYCSGITAVPKKTFESTESLS